MTDEKGPNFLEEIIEADLDAGKYKSIITRFPPEPNGYLHLGHAKSICLNFGLALQFGGSTNLRFDDTNPTKEETEYVDSIKNDVKWLGFNWAHELYASDYFEELYGFAVKLIRKDLAYVDDSTSDEIASTWCSVLDPWPPKVATPVMAVMKTMVIARSAAGKAWALKERVGAASVGSRRFTAIACCTHFAVAMKYVKTMQCTATQVSAAKAPVSWW